MGAAIEVFDDAAADRGRPRPLPAGQDHQRPAGAALGRLRPRRATLRARPGRRGRAAVRRPRRRATTSWSASSTSASPTGAPSLQGGRGRSWSRATGPSAHGVTVDGRAHRRTAAGGRSRRGHDALGLRSAHGCQPHADRPAEHRATSTSSGSSSRSSRCQPYDQPLLEALGLPVCRGRRRADGLPAFDNSAMDGYAVYYDDVAARHRRPPGAPAGRRRDRPPARPSCFALSPGHRGRDHDRRPGARTAPTRSCPSSGPTAASRTVRITRAPERGQHVRPAGEDVAAGDVLLEDGTRPRPAPARPARRRSAAPQVALAARVRGSWSCRPAPSCASPARRWATTRSTTRNSYMLAAAARAGRRDRLPGRASSPTTRATFRDALRDQLVRADLVVTSGGVSKGDYDVVKEVLCRARHGLVRRGRDAARQAAGLRLRRRGRDPDLHAAGQPGLVVRLLRGVRAARASAG